VPIPDLSDLTPGELSALLGEASARLQAAEAAATANETRVRDRAGSDVDDLIAMIGEPVPAYMGFAVTNPAYVLPLDTINGLLAEKRSVVNADPARYIFAMLRLMRREVKAQISTSRAASGRFDSDSTGAEE
jgi:hypothetical protein